MKFLQRVWDEIKQGENIDLYITIIVAIGITLLNILGIAPPAILAPITLGVLGLLAITSIGNRHRIDDLHARFAKAKDIFYLEEFPSTLRNDFETAREVWIVGVSLSRTIKTNYHLIEKKLQQSHVIKVLLVHPEGPGIEMAVSRNYARRDVTQKSVDVQGTLQYLCDLKKVAPDKLEIRTIQNPLGYGVIAINPNSVGGVLYLENYPYRVVSDSLPKFVLKANDGRWYEMYKKELEYLWSDGIEWPCREVAEL